MPTINLQEFEESIKKQSGEITNFWRERGYERTPEGSWLRVGTSADVQKEELDIESKKLDIVGKQKDLADELIPEPKQYEREAARGMAAIDEAVNQIETLSRRVNTSNNRLFQSGRWFGGITQLDPDSAQLMSMRAYLAPIVRSLGEKGNLSEGDMARAIGAIPGVTDTREVAQRKINTLKNILGAAQRGFEGSQNQDPLGLFGE
jgi:hypothetical protein